MGESMRVFSGYSSKSDALGAIVEATESWPHEVRLDLIIVFTSTEQNPDEVAAVLAERFPGVRTAGCTTAGEFVGSHHSNGGLVTMGLATPQIRWSVAVANNLSAFDEDAARALSDRMFAELGIVREEIDPAKYFSLVFVDGLSLKEEVVSSLMADALEGIPLLGGSSGDDLKFGATHIFADGKAHRNSAVFVVAEPSIPFEIVKHQHYTTTPRAVVITRADVAKRRVYEMDGYPALEAYARALGIKTEEVTQDVAFANPLTFVCNGDIFVRSIMRIEPDQSLTFYCGIEEGMVLSIGGHTEMEDALEQELSALVKRFERVDLFIVCNCILRALEAKKDNHTAALGKILSHHSKNVIGFDTYGEQLSGLHINQTLVGIALRDPSHATPPAEAV